MTLTLAASREAPLAVPAFEENIGLSRADIETAMHCIGHAMNCEHRDLGKAVKRRRNEALTSVHNVLQMLEAAEVNDVLVVPNTPQMRALITRKMNEKAVCA